MNEDNLDWGALSERLAIGPTIQTVEAIAPSHRRVEIQTARGQAVGRPACERPRAQ